MLVKKLRIYAMLMRLQEMEAEAFLRQRKQLKQPITSLKLTNTIEEYKPLSYLGKNGKPFPPHKSKYHN